ncbi:MAG TPA: hypothetical protein VF695_02780 [Sphingomonas sp.]|jgi:cytoskeletal protein RodZ
MIISSFWIIVVFIGAFVLFAAIIWSRQQNKKVTPQQDRRSETATHDLYRDQDRDDKANGG